MMNQRFSSLAENRNTMQKLNEFVDKVERIFKILNREKYGLASGSSTADATYDEESDVNRAHAPQKTKGCGAGRILTAVGSLLSMGSKKKEKSQNAPIQITVYGGSPSQTSIVQCPPGVQQPGHHPNVGPGHWDWVPDGSKHPTGPQQGYSPTKYTPQSGPVQYSSPVPSRTRSRIPQDITPQVDQRVCSPGATKSTTVATYDEEYGVHRAHAPQKTKGCGVGYALTSVGNFLSGSKKKEKSQKDPQPPIQIVVFGGSPSQTSIQQCPPTFPPDVQQPRYHPDVDPGHMVWVPDGSKHPTGYSPTDYKPHKGYSPTEYIPQRGPVQLSGESARSAFVQPSQGNTLSYSSRAPSSTRSRIPQDITTQVDQRAC